MHKMLFFCFVFNPLEVLNNSGFWKAKKLLQNKLLLQAPTVVFLFIYFL